MIRPHIIKKFWENTDVRGRDECWNYTSGVERYPRCGSLPAYHISWMIHYGRIPRLNINRRKIVLRHLCHNKRCVNPYHLALGTHSDNQLDRFVRKVPIDNVYVARRLRSTHRLTYREIGNLLGVSGTTARIAVLGIGSYKDI